MGASAVVEGWQLPKGSRAGAGRRDGGGGLHPSLPASRCWLPLLAAAEAEDVLPKASALSHFTQST